MKKRLLILLLCGMFVCVSAEVASNQPKGDGKQITEKKAAQAGMEEKGRNTSEKRKIVRNISMSFDYDLVLPTLEIPFTLPDTKRLRLIHFASPG